MEGKDANHFVSTTLIIIDDLFGMTCLIALGWIDLEGPGQRPVEWSAARKTGAKDRKNLIAEVTPPPSPRGRKILQSAVGTQVGLQRRHAFAHQPKSYGTSPANIYPFIP